MDFQIAQRHLAFRPCIILLFLVHLSLSGISQAGSNPGQRIEPVYGAGPSTQIVTLFFKHFSKRPESARIKFVVPERSTKHAGGIRASSQYLFGRTGRPLSKQEREQNKFEILLGKVPVGFATSPAVMLPPLDPSDIESIFSGRISSWRDLGGPAAPIVLVGREKTEAVLVVLSKYFPNLLEAKYQKILRRDHAVVNFLSSPAGKYAIGYGAVSNFHNLNAVEFRGPPLGINVGLVVDRKNIDHPLVKAAERYAHGEEWRQRIDREGYYVADDANRRP